MNTSNGNLYHLWSAESNRYESGFILCEIQVVKYVYNFVHLLEVTGESKGYVEMKLVLESGCSGPHKETETIKKISKQAHTNFWTIGSSSSRQKQEMKKILEVTGDMDISEHKFLVDLSIPCHLYQPEVTVNMNDGTSLVLKGTGISKFEKLIMEEQVDANNPN